MRKLIAATAVLVLTSAPTAVALAPGYGYYLGGDASRGNFAYGDKPGVSLVTHQGDFYVITWMFRERCANGKTTMVIFPHGTPDASNPLSGVIGPTGRFSATESIPAGEVTVRGRLVATTGHVTITAHGRVKGGPGAVCQGSHTFTLTMRTAGGGR